MKVGFVIYNGMTALDFVGVYDPVVRLKTMGFIPELEWQICALAPQVQDSTGLSFAATKVSESLEEFDMVIVPGGFGSRKLSNNADFIAWLKTAESCKLKVAVCTGALLLGAAGFLKDKKATTHPSAFKELRKYCLQVLDNRIVDEGEVITAGGVTASIDLGLYLCGRLAGETAREEIRRQMDYSYS